MNIWISGFSAAFAMGESPAMMPSGISHNRGNQKPEKDGLDGCPDLFVIGWRTSIGALHRTLSLFDSAIIQRALPDASNFALLSALARASS
ncbi:hypothetical protein [Hoeflea alexandrii]